MTIKIYAQHLSPYVHFVLNACKEVGVPYEYIPVLVDGDFRLFEGRAIARYIVRKYGAHTTLLPKPGDIEKEALFEQAASIEQFDWQPYALIVVVETYTKPPKGADQDTERLTEFLGKLRNSLRGYDRILSKQKYLAGDDVTLADLFHQPLGSILTKGGVDLLVGTEFPNVARWWEDISNRPAWLETQAELEKLKVEYS